MDLTLKKEIKKKFMHYALPSVMAMWVYTIYTMVDGMFVSRGVGTTALAAVNISMPLINTSFALGILFAVGASTRASYYKGQGNYKRANEVVTESAITVFILGLIVSTIVTLNLDKLVAFLGADAETHDYVRNYLHIIVSFVPCYMVGYNLEVLVKADGYPEKAIKTSFVCAFTNIFLDWLFVMVFHWGIQGAAIATGIAQTVSLVIFGHHFARKPKREDGLHFVKVRWRIKEAIGFAKLGFADSVTEFSVGVIIFMFNNILLKISGNDGVVIYTVIAYVSQLVLMTMMGINQGMQPLVSFYYGKGEPKTYKYILRIALITAGTASIVAFLLGLIYPNPAVGVFIDKALNPQLYLDGIAAFRLFSFSFIPLGFVIIFYGYFTALEFPREAMSISVGRGLVFISISLIVMSYLFGETGVWLSMVVSEFTALALALILYRKRFKGAERKAL